MDYLIKYWLLTCLSFLGCNTNSQQSSISKISQTPLMMELKLYPTGVIEDLRYSIKIKGEGIEIINHMPMNEGDLSEHKGTLSLDQQSRLKQLASQIVNPIGNKELGVVDTWGAQLKIDGKIMYEDDDFAFDKPPKEIRELIALLKRLSEVKIELYSFS